jgi:phosphopantetheine--protein transferase-like protein
LSFAPLLRRPLRFGACVGVALPESDDFALPPELHPDEAAYARTLAPARRAGWVGGRVAMRAALAGLGLPPAGAMLATSRGAPALPPGVAGSVSHKRELAVAIAARARGTPPATLGIDVEIPRRLRHDISRHVLTPDERAALAPLDAGAREAEVLWRFAAKEAIYKALDPWVERMVSFQEVTLVRAAGGGTEVRLALTGGEGPFAVELEDAGDAALVLIAARVSRPAA